MVYQTPQGSMNIRGKKVVIETDGFETKVSMVEGETTVQGNEGADGGGETIKGGQQAIIRRLPGRAPTIEIQAIPDNEMAEIQDKVTLACNARKTVYFDVAAKKELTEEGAAEGEVPTDTTEEEEDLSAGDAGTGEGWATIFDQADGETVDAIVVVEVTPVELPQEIVEVSPARIKPTG